ECLRDVYKDKAFRERGIEVKDINAIFRKYYNSNGVISNAPSSNNLRSKSASNSSINSIGSTSSISSDNGNTRNHLINEGSRDSDDKNKTLTEFKNQIANPQNNKLLIKIKNIENIITKYLSEAMNMNSTVTPSDKTPSFSAKSIAILMHIYMNFIQNLRN
ncbi:hypothetical protein PCHDK_000496100, partial [Plasmodium chabaudi adami]